MTCTELARLLPDLLDGTLLDAALLEEATIALARCPACRRELAAAREVRDLLAKLRSKGYKLVPSSDFETNLLFAIHHLNTSQRVEDFSRAKTQVWIIMIKGNHEN